MRIVDKGNDIIIEGHLYSLVCDTIGTATIKVYEDNAYLTSVTTDEYGFFHIVIPTSTVGVRNFKLIYEGDANYTGSESTTIEVTVRDAPVLDEIILVSDKLLCQLGERFHFTATCQSQYDDDLAGIQVQLKKDGTTIQTITTGTDGKAYLKFTPNATGSYSITATSGNVSSDPILVVVSEGNIYEIIADLNEFPGTYSKEEIDALLLALKTLLEESKADIGHIHQISDIPNLQALLDDKVTWEAFYNSGGGGGGGGDVPIVANWTSNPSDSRVPSEKLTKNTLDTKSDVGHTHDDRYYTETEIDDALLIKQDLLVSGTNIKTINNQSLLGSGNITIQGGGSDVDIVTSWEPTPSDTKVPSEKLTKNTLDNKVDKSSTTGLLKNDGTVDTTSYSTFSGSYNDLSGKPTIPSASTTTPSADTTSGSYGSGTNYARSNHTHPKSSLYAEATHSHTKSQITDFPSIPSKTSDLTNDGADGTNVFVANNDSRLTDARTPSSHSHGNITNDGKIGTKANYFVYTTTGGAVTSKQKIGNINYLGRIGSTANLPLITTTNGTIATGSFGSSANTFCEGNDSRLSDARTPTSHTHTKSEITDFPTIPSKTSDLTNDSGFITSSSLPTKTSDLTNDGDGTNAFLTQHQSLSNYVQKSSTTGLIKNDGSVDTTQYLSSLPSHNHDDRYYTESEMDDALDDKQDLLVSGTNIKTINNTSLLGSGNITIGGGGSSVDIATSWGNPTSDSKVPSEKLTKSSLDSKIDKSQTVGLVKNDGSIDTTSYSTFSGSYNDLTNKPSIPSSSSDLSDGSDLVKKSSTSGLIKNDGTIDTTSYSTFNGNYNNLTNKPTIPSKTSDLTNDSNFISKSSTNGLMKNDGTIDTTNYVNTNDSRLSDARTPLSHTHTSSQVTDLIDVIYPVGSIYMSVNSTSPQTLFGGTWEQIKDTFLLASGDTYANGTTGGSADATLVSHNHTTRETGEYFVTSENSDSNNTKVSYSASGNRYVDGMTSNSKPFHHRTATGYEGSSATGKNMPPYLTVFVWKRTA